MFKRFKKEIFKIETDTSYPEDQKILDDVHEVNFSLNKLESWRYHNFCKEHKTCFQEHYSTTGGNITISIIPTGVGVAKIVECGYCKCRKNITDFCNW